MLNDHLHGVGRYLGLVTLNVGGMTGEFPTLEYANKDKLYVLHNEVETIEKHRCEAAFDHPRARIPHLLAPRVPLGTGS
jgi:transcription-repair coupling factor (superfamily II helicase)